MKLPLLKGSEYKSLESVLQGLYHLCPLRQRIFESNDKTDSTGPLRLVFAKMYYDLENGKESTDASIYFKDSYLKAEPSNFYSMISRDLFSSERFRGLLQWDLQTSKKYLETSTETRFEEQSDMLQVDTSKASLQAFLDSLIKPTVEQVSVVFDGEEQKRSIEVKREFAQIPEIPSFSISHLPEIEFAIEETIILPNGIEYALSVVILNENDKYFVCLRDDKSMWFKIKDQVMEAVTQESVLLAASKHGHMVFYLNKKSSIVCSSETKPSQQVLMDSLTKSTTHTITKTIQRHASDSSNSPRKALPLPDKSKNMILNPQHSYSVSFTGADNSPNTGAFKSNPVLSLQALKESKSPSLAELAHLETILVPADLSGVHMKLDTSGTFKSLSRSESDKFEESFVDNEHTKQFENNADLRSDFFDSSPDLELDYFEEHAHHKSTSNSIWSTHYLNHPVSDSKHSSLFARMLNDENHGWGFHDSHSQDGKEDGSLDENEKESRHLFVAEVDEGEESNLQEQFLRLRQRGNHPEQSAQLPKKPSLFNGIFSRSKVFVVPIAESDTKKMSHLDNESNV